MRSSSYLLLTCKSICVAFLFFISFTSRAETNPITPLALYTFHAGAGSTVYDTSGNGVPLDLNIDAPDKTRWIPGGGLSIEGPTLIASPDRASKIVNAIKASNALTIETWIQPATEKQAGPARIVTLSADTLSRNFMLGQSRTTYETRLRTTRTDDNGIPSLRSKKGSLDTRLTHVVYTRDSKGVARLYVNGALQSRKRDRGDLSNWDDNYRIALGNEFTSDRPWLGDLYQMAIFDEVLNKTDVVQHYAAGVVVATDSSYYQSGTGTVSNNADNTLFGDGSGSGTVGLSNPADSTTTGDTSISASGSISIGWKAPVARSDGSVLALNEIAGYTIYYGQTVGAYPNSVHIDNAFTTSTEIANLPPGSYYFVITAWDTSGRESGYSEVAKKVIL